MRKTATGTIGAAVGALAVVGALALAGCGTSTNAQKPAAGGTATTVSARDIAGVGTALVTSAGDTIYFTDQDTAASIRCMGACAQVWKPVTVSAGTAPTAGDGVTGALATVTRPDGAVQVTYDGKPLYTFTFDSGPGKAGGNGVTDNFNNTQFTWHAAVATGSAPSGTPSSGGGGGYGY